MSLARLLRNELVELLTQGGSHEQLFRAEINGRAPGAEPGDAAERYFEQWQLPPLGFRNYWYPVILASDLKGRPIRRRLLGEDIVFWRDGGKLGALADRCPHRGASLGDGHLRFPGSGTISCPYHGWTFDPSGQLRACIQEGPDSAMPAKVRTKAYPVEERLGIVWVWIGDLEPVAIDDDLPVAMTVPGVTSFVHFTKTWDTNWALLFDNFADGLHAPYVHRSSPQFLFHRLGYRTIGAEPHVDCVEHERILEMPRFETSGRPAFSAEFPDLGRFPRHDWRRRLPPRRKPSANFVPGFRPNSFLHGLPSYIHTVHEDQYFTQFIIPIDRDHLYNMCAMTGRHTPRSRLRWTFQFQLFRITHDRMFIGQDHRILKHPRRGSERLSAWDQDVIRWRKFAVEHARGYKQSQAVEQAAALVEAHGSLAEWPH